MSLKTSLDSPQPRAATALLERLLLDRQVGIGEAGRDVPDQRPLVAVDEPGVRAGGLDDREPARRTASSAPTRWGRNPAAASAADQPAVARDQRDVGLAVARVDGEHTGEQAV